MKYNRNNIEKKRSELFSEKTRRSSKVSLFLFKYVIIISIAVVVAGLGLVTGFVRGVLKSAPAISKESVHSKGYITTIYNNKGKAIKTLSNHDSNRIYKSISDIPQNLQNAFIAIEDERFYSHNGIDLYGIIRATFLGIKNQELSQGGSTLTQQLIKNNVLGIKPENTTVERVERKIKEQSMALELEQIVSKQYILEEYLNAINLGGGTLGVQTASKRYFNKDVSELTLSESAVLASITKNPTRYNPITHPENNASRRLLVLQNMLDQHYITREEYSKAVSDDVYTRIKKVAEMTTDDQGVNSYFHDALILQVVKDLKEQLGYDETTAYNAVYSGGLKIYSTQDSQVQKIADKVTNDASNYPAGTKVALSYALTTKDANGETQTYTESNVLSYMKKHNLGNSLIFNNKSAAKDMAKRYRKSVVKSGEEMVGESLHTTIQPQVSMTIIDQKTGAVEALVGGRGTKITNLSLNRATTTERQPGSTFKVLSAFLPALDNNDMTLATVYDDAPYNYIDTNQTVHNWYRGYYGYASLRMAITNSMNIVAAKTIADVTPEVAYDYLTDMGFTTLVDNHVSSTGTTHTDISQTLALGGLTYGVTNMELTGAYASIANGGTYYKPSLYTRVVDESGRVLLKNDTDGKRVMKESTAFLLTDAMKDVITKGTATQARLSTGMVSAGKTGTTTNNFDHWFTGYTPYHTASVWMGYDRNTAFSAQNLDKVIWKKVMDQVVIKKKENKSKDFKKASNVVRAKICSKSGKLALKGVCDHDPRGNMIKTEYFAKGTVPTQTCDTHVAVELCAESGYPVTDHCPAKGRTRRIYIVRRKNSVGVTDDTPYLLPRKYREYICGLHQNESVPSE